MTRTGKIARLPPAVREELNRRLREAEPGGPLVEACGGGPRSGAPARFRAGDSDAKTQIRSGRVKPSQT